MILNTEKMVAADVLPQALQLQQSVDAGKVRRTLILAESGSALRPDVDSYAIAAQDRFDRVRQYTGRLMGRENVVPLGRLVRYETKAQKELPDFILGANADPEVDEILFLWGKTKKFGPDEYDSLAALIAEEKDVEGMSPRLARLNGNRPLPLTSGTVMRMLRHIRMIGRDDKGQELKYAITGDTGKTTGQGAVRALRAALASRGIDYDKRAWGINSENPDEFPDAVAWANVVLNLSGHPSNEITREMIHPGVRAVLGVSGYDISQDAYECRDVIFTPRRGDRSAWGSGTLTCSNLVTAAWEVPADRYHEPLSAINAGNGMLQPT